MRRRLTSLLCAAVAVPALLAGCGGGDAGEVTVTVHTGTGATTATGTTTTTAATGTTAPTATDDGASLELRLPAQDSVSGLTEGTPKPLPTAAALVAALYTANDPTAPVARARLEAAGYEQGVIRDQNQATGSTGPRLLRIYIFRLRDGTAARAEVLASITEVKATTSYPMTDIAVPDTDGKGLRITAGTQKILFVTFAAGRDVYGIQSFSTSGGTTHEPEVMELAGNLYRAWNTTP